MTNLIQDTAVQAWTSGRKTRRNNKGWVSGNAVCCPHNGESVDKRGRGGLIANPEGSVSYSCFNCNFHASYVPGYSLNYKFRKLLKWLNVDDSTITQLSIDALREQKRQEMLGIIKPEVKKEEVKVNFKKEELPEESSNFWAMVEMEILRGDNTFPLLFTEAVSYVDNRKIDMQKYDFYWSTSTKNKMNHRVIVPFTWKNEVIGYSARALNDDIKPKYIQQVDSGYVFNIDKQDKNWKFVIVCEGVFDALSIDAVAVLRSDITQQKIDIIESLEREIIVVPDWDKSGDNLIDVALKNAWTVSFPVWAETCEDINQAVRKYGKLFVMKTILDARESNPLKINLLRRKYIGK